MSWQCNKCSFENRETAQFCRKCGTQRPSVSSVSAQLANTGLLSANTLLQKRYQVINEIAKGGQGAVYAATDKHTGRKVAIKAVRLEAIASPENYTEAVARIRHEADFLARLRHPNIVQVLDQFEENHYPYVVMEYIDGQTLARLVASAGGRLPEPEAVHLIRQLCAALAYLHAQTPPIIFRDMKPQNVMVDAFQNVKLIDFGIARTYRAGAHSDTQVFGSIGFAAPEQYGSEQTDARSDIYSLGVTLHYMVTGYNPAANPDPLGTPPSVRMLNPAISVDLEQIIVRATQFEPADRWQTILELDAVLSKRPAQARPFSPTTPANCTLTCWNCQKPISATTIYCRQCGARQTTVI
jgi:serine/threonine protein kinase, bacterial